MIVRMGITGFFLHKPIPEFSFADFKHVVHSSAALLGFDVLRLTERGVTPNFHTAQLARHSNTLTMLGHSTYPIIAFAEPLTPNMCELRFRDATSISKRIAELFPDATIAYADDLSRRIEPTDLAQLNRAERDQVKFWKPRTIGELAFNWWD